MTTHTAITIHDLATAAGIGVQKARRLVREGKLPGFIAGSDYVCSPGEFQDWLQGRWQYRGIPSSEARKRAPKGERPAMLHRVKTEAA